MKKELGVLVLICLVFMGGVVNATQTEEEMYAQGYGRSLTCGNNICEKAYFEVLFGETKKISINNREVSFYLDTEGAFHVNDVSDRPNGAMQGIRNEINSKYGFSTRDASYLYRNPEAQNYEDRNPYGNYVTIYEEDYCSKDCIQGLSSIKVEKGWNLLSRNILTDLRLKNLNQGFYYDSNFQYVFEYIPYMNSYIQSKPQNTQDEKRFTDFSATLSQDKQTKLGANTQRIGSVWVYSNYTGELLFNKDILLGDFSGVPLISGWNFLSFTSDMVGKNMGNIKGDCDIEKIFAYVGGNWRNWFDKTGEKNNLDVAFIPEENLGVGFIMKVSSDCTLGSSSSNVNPPSLPIGDNSGEISNFFPSNIGDYSLLDGPTLKGTECINLENSSDARAFNLSGEICFGETRALYQDSSNNCAFVISTDITKNNLLYNQFLNLISSSFKIESYDIRKVENHELMWYSSEPHDAIMVQECTYNLNSNGEESYNYGTATGDNAVTKYFINNYPPIIQN